MMVVIYEESCNGGYKRYSGDYKFGDGFRDGSYYGGVLVMM